MFACRQFIYAMEEEASGGGEGGGGGGGGGGRHADIGPVVSTSCMAFGYMCRQKQACREPLSCILIILVPAHIEMKVPPEG